MGAVLIPLRAGHSVHCLQTQLQFLVVVKCSETAAVAVVVVVFCQLSLKRLRWWLVRYLWCQIDKTDSLQKKKRNILTHLHKKITHIHCRVLRLYKANIDVTFTPPITKRQFLLLQLNRTLGFLQDLKLYEQFSWESESNNLRYFYLPFVLILLWYLSR